ncbi:LLM class flavin-dependent oxidoreductase [Amycolatopsis sp. GM8]|uniref:LLM class flavin-dependent oxidoreductase n=1 Tax=Amycolatopsis sp. GM8 TaxID=2896530 RepID=UPI001F3C50E0|nr:LLM class flavin-dependent oxidoreductase [Amycolatopsis sp. GM8]
MRIGIAYLSMSESTGRSASADKLAEFFTEVEWANDKGFSGIWITEHHFSTYSVSSSPLVLLAKAAQVAPDLRVGTALLVLPLWDPVRLAADVATLDVLSGGRFDFGVGRGYQPHEFLGLDRDFGRNREMFEEAIGLIRRLFTEDELMHDGPHYSIRAPVTLLPRPVQRPHPPIWMSATSPESLRFAARNGFNFLTGAGISPGEVLRRRAAADAELGGAVPAGREFSTSRYVYCGQSTEGRELAVREVCRQLQVSRSLARGAVPRYGCHPDPGAQLDRGLLDAAAGALIAGGPDEVAEQIEALGRSGVTQVIGAFRYGALPRTVASDSIRLFAAEVLPRLAETTAVGAAL